MTVWDLEQPNQGQIGPRKFSNVKKSISSSKRCTAKPIHHLSSTGDPSPADSPNSSSATLSPVLEIRKSYTLASMAISSSSLFARRQGKNLSAPAASTLQVPKTENPNE